MVGLAVALAVLLSAACCSVLYLGWVRRHAWLLEHTYPCVYPDAPPDATEVWEPPPRLAPTGSWSAFSSSQFPANDRQLTALEMQSLRHFYRDKHNDSTGWTSGSAVYQTY